MSVLNTQQFHDTLAITDIGVQCIGICAEVYTLRISRTLGFQYNTHLHIFDYRAVCSNGDSSKFSLFRLGGTDFVPNHILSDKGGIVCISDTR